MSFHSINNVMNSPSFELECCVHFRQCWFHFQRSRPLDGLCGFFTLFQRCFLLCACVCFRFYFHVLGLGTAFTVTDAEVLFLSLTFLVEISGFSLSFLVHSIPNVFPASFFIHVFLKLFWASIFFSVRSERFRFSFSYLFFFWFSLLFVCVSFSLRVVSSSEHSFVPFFSSLFTFFIVSFDALLPRRKNVRNFPFFGFFSSVMCVDIFAGFRTIGFPTENGVVFQLKVNIPQKLSNFLFVFLPVFLSSGAHNSKFLFQLFTLERPRVHSFKANDICLNIQLFLFSPPFTQNYF